MIAGGNHTKINPKASGEIRFPAMGITDFSTPLCSARNDIGSTINKKLNYCILETGAAGGFSGSAFADIGNLGGEYDAVGAKNKMQEYMQKDSKHAWQTCIILKPVLCKPTKKHASYFSFPLEKLGIQCKRTIILWVAFWGFDEGV